MSRFRNAVLVSITTIVTVGCLPATRVVKNPGDRDRGVRYYRPKPYLLITPMINKSGEPVAGFVSMEQVTMPDFSEEYSIHIRTGLGSNTTSITLTDGWRLDSLNVELDSNFDENLSAIADVAKAVPSLTSSNGDPDRKIPCPASNVPIGYYEAVISQGCKGKKRLYGFRYVGFMPYSACPLESCGSEQQSCYEGQVYGLHFDGKQMTFQLLRDIPAAKEAYRPAETVQIETGQIEPETLPIPSDDSMLDDDDRSSRIEFDSVTP